MMKCPTTKYYHFLYILICLSFTLFVSCKVNKHTESPKISPLNKDSEIVFLTFNITKENDYKHIHLINKIVTKGTLKQNTPLKEGSQGDLKCELLNKNKKTIESFIVKNPLIKSIEYVDETRQFKTKQLNLDIAQFSLRLQLKSNISYILISEVDTLNRNSKTLIKTKIN